MIFPKTAVFALVATLFNHASAQKSSGDVRTLVYNGEDVQPNTYPWFARMTVYDYFGYCGGSLVTPEYVLTAANCVLGRDLSDAAFQIGALCTPYGPDSSNNCGQETETIGISSFREHPYYDYSTKAYDFALVRLDRPSTITPVNLDMAYVSEGYEASNPNSLVVLGLGIDNDYYYSSTRLHLQAGSPKYLDQATCSSMHDNDNYHDSLGEGTLCTTMGDKYGGDAAAQPCSSDQGGPLYDSDNDVLVGVFSWRRGGCGDSNDASVYARVGEEIEWIKSEICENHNDPQPSFCPSWTTIYEDDFENGRGAFLEKGRLVAFSVPPGEQSLGIRMKSKLTSEWFDVRGKLEVKVTFSYYPTSGMEMNDELLLMIRFHGSAWTEVWNGGDTYYYDDYWYQITVETEIPAGSPRMKLRFQGNSDAVDDDVYIDNVLVEGLVPPST